MDFRQRTVRDMNRFTCTCRVMEEPVLTTIKEPDGKISAFTRFLCVTNSNKYTSKVNCHFYVQAKRSKAERLCATIHKGYGFFFEGEMKEILEKKTQKTLRTSVLTKYLCFDIEQFHIISIPDLETKEETTTDIFHDIQE